MQLQCDAAKPADSHIFHRHFIPTPPHSFDSPPYPLTQRINPLYRTQNKFIRNNMGSSFSRILVVAFMTVQCRASADYNALPPGQNSPKGKKTKYNRDEAPVLPIATPGSKFCREPLNQRGNQRDKEEIPEKVPEKKKMWRRLIC